MTLTRGLAAVVIAAIAGATIVSFAITLLAVFDGENPNATVSFDGAMQWFGVTLVFSFPLVLGVGLVLALPTYVIASRSGALSMGRLSVLGISMGALGGLVVAMIVSMGLVQSAMLGSLAGLGAAIAWWFSVERQRYLITTNGN